MKNPFQSKLVPFEARPGKWWVVYEGAEKSAIDNTYEQCAYAAHAINQHEKLVGLLRVCDPILKGGVPASLRSEVRRELAALLEEEKSL